ncbi:hypothetical protein JOL62DRAFT_263718 [Phyllosticta paracitricarpa]|uniref:Uncharacterized protein n=1 Tax=Phyllosticta paracitricarpa TaxID=2016321 RepID=A0ABR1MX62_9PEZI
MLARYLRTVTGDRRQAFGPPLSPFTNKLPTTNLARIGKCITQHALTSRRHKLTPRRRVIWLLSYFVLCRLKNLRSLSSLSRNPSDHQPHCFTDLKPHRHFSLKTPTQRCDTRNASISTRFPTDQQPEIVFRQTTMNRKRLRTANEAVVPTAGSSRAQRQDLGQGHGRNNHIDSNQRPEVANQTLPTKPASGGGRGRGQRRGRGRGRRRKKAAQKEEIEDDFGSKLKECAKNFIACRDNSETIEGPFEGRWKIWSPRSIECDTPLFTAVKAIMQQWAKKDLYHWGMAENMEIWSVDVEYHRSWFMEKRLPGFGEAICIRPWFTADGDEQYYWKRPAYLVKAWVGQGGEVVIELSEEDEIPLTKLLDEMAARHYQDLVCHDTIWNFWMGNDKKFDWAGLPGEIKLNIMGHLVQEEEIQPYEKPMGRGAIARGERDPPPELANGWQIMEGLWWALPRRCPDFVWRPYPINTMATDFLLATNVFCFQNLKALMRFLKNMGPEAQKVRKIKLHFQYEDLLLLFCNSSLPLVTDPGDNNTSRVLKWHVSVDAIKSTMSLLKAMNLTEMKFHVRKTRDTCLEKLAHYGYMPWKFECHRSMHIFIFRQMVTHFAHVRKLGVEFENPPHPLEDAIIHDFFAKIHYDAANHPEGELKMARKARENARLLEICGECDNSDGGVELPCHQPKLKACIEHDTHFPELERAHDPVVWRDGAQQSSNVVFPCKAHPQDRCIFAEDCIFGTYTPGRRRGAPAEWEPIDEDGIQQLEEWKAAQTSDEFDEREASYPSFSPWLDPESLLDEDSDEDE